MPTLDESPDWASNFGPQQVLAPSPVWGEKLTWDPRAPHTPMLDQKGRVWIATKIRDPLEGPEFCKTGSTNKFAAYYPIDRGGYQAVVYDPTTKKFSMIDTADASEFVGVSINSLVPPFTRHGRSKPTKTVTRCLGLSPRSWAGRL